MDGSDDFVESFLAHFGVKGMKWGVRKNDDPASAVKQRTESLHATLKNGDTITLDGERTPAMVRFLAKLSPSIRERVNNSSSFKIKDPQGKDIGEMTWFKESPTSLNVVWVGIDNSQRGKGYASAAMQAAVAHARNTGMKSVTLEVPGKSPDARHIYERMGFKKVGEITTPDDDPVWGGLTSMRLDLDGEVRHADIPDRSIVIVAIPSDKDPVWKLSSEKVPHLTLMYLGDQADDEAIIRMTQYLSHVVKTSMCRFGLGVDRRGTLGDKNADVLFFDTNYGAEKLREIRSYLLANDDIYNAYHSTEQYEKWLPHLTMGYPETPAHPDTREYPGIDWINFDRIALWTGDYEGAEFQLYEQELSMSDANADFLEHFGVKGMKWGVRKDKGHEGEQVKVSKLEKLDRKFEQRAGSLGVYLDIHNAAAKMTNANDIERINNKPQYKGQDFSRDTPLRRKYYREHQKAYLDNVEKAAKDMGTNASGTKEYRIVELPGRDGLGLGTWEVHIDNVKHADISDDVASYEVKVLYNDMGHIVSIEEQTDELQQSHLDEFLEHFGVKGMKWGVTREKLGTLQEARERLQDAKGRKEHDHKDKSSVREFRKRADKQGVRTLGDKELKQLVARAELEAKYKKLRKEEKEASRAFLKAMWDGFGKELLGAVIREGVAYKFRNMGNSGSTRATVIDGRVIEGASRALGK